MPSQIDTLLRLVTDNPQHVLTHLASHPEIASTADFSGYTLAHAASSYGQLDLLRTLVRTYNVNVNILDSDGETPLFAAETLVTAKCLVEELGADVNVRSQDGISAAGNARENEEDGSGWAEVAAYLEEKSGANGGISEDGSGGVSLSDVLNTDNTDMHAPPPLPPNVKINMGTMQEAPMEGEEGPDPEIRRRIEELAAREDFQTEQGQKELHDLIAQVVGGMSEENGREVRRRIEEP